MAALKLKRVQDLDVSGKRVLMRVDYNVPLKDGRVEDATRIEGTIPTLKHLLGANCRIVLISHLGRPKGKSDPRYSLRPAASELEKLVGAPVRFCEDCVGSEVSQAVSSLQPGEVCLLENLRFHAGEEKNDPGFAKSLAGHGEIFIQEAFGTLHRAHASTAELPKYLPSGIGFLVQKELEFLDRIINNPVRPFLAILGGAKVSDKIGVLHKLLERVDALLIGGGMAFTFLEAQGNSTGKSLVEKDKVEDARTIIEKAYGRNIGCLLPADHITVLEVKPDAEKKLSQGMAVPEGRIGVDVGPRTLELFREEILQAKTIFWNGPMGIFETEAFAHGSVGIAKTVAEATRQGATTIVGGGDTLSVLKRAGVKDITHCSTGGGASLQFLEGKILPGLAALSESPA